MKKIAPIVVIIAILGVVGAGIWYVAQSDLVQNLLKSKSYSEDQQKVIDAFGVPQGYTIVQATDEPKTEVWQYPLLDAVFTFADGAFVSRAYKSFDADEERLMYASIEPKDWSSITTLDEVRELLDTEPYLVSDINNELLENAKIYNFGNLVSVGTMDDQVVFIKTMVYQDTGEDLPEEQSEDTSMEDMDTTGDTAWMIGRVFSMDDRFSVFVDTEYQNQIYATMEYVGDSRSHVFCFRGKDNATEGPCESAGVPIFSIDEYSQAQYGEIQKSEFADMYSKIGEDGDTVYVFSHPNGDVPEELQDGKIMQIYDYVTESFMIGEPK